MPEEDFEAPHPSLNMSLDLKLGLGVSSGVLIVGIVIFFLW